MPIPEQQTTRNRVAINDESVSRKKQFMTRSNLTSTIQNLSKKLFFLIQLYLYTLPS
jgi:hypothetical protein